MTDTEDRRPLNSRNTWWAKAIAQKIAARSVTPNQISQASIAAAFIAGLLFFVAGRDAGYSRMVLLALAALFCQVRLLCNLFDGMVAVEGGKAEADGPFWNEFPDRAADMLIFAGIGLGIDHPGLGWAAAAFAVLTAYVRELGRATGHGSDFSGPMAKQHRMAIVTMAAVISIGEPYWDLQNHVLWLGLWIVLLGAAATAARRSLRLIRSMKTPL
ncbi:CDP-alcohol phosphatidyltransferase family protein [Rhizobium mongolense]|uniref:Phosphatidylglycerophosphate synthase n=2 Tax=Rhizobium mongolense TaxID=57676 RepID=A0ABR6IGJ4_9HYPH|nr:CDP-alcohol phosphatidyltransferase family protein [Rhizobium mongolense]MBB4226773.1 phosphatidylglycerophosphate synthase [Rhizobium mongolense]TVZ73997.1 phosphatidylglycerophosphate synthase [Rhizobium mongolense USDA 1844]